MTDRQPKTAAGAPRSSQDDLARQLPKRFYKDATIAAKAVGYGIELDGRSVKTPRRAPLTVPTEALAIAIAAEWNGLGDVIDPAFLPLTKIANTAIDGVTGRETEVHDDIVRYVGNDLIYYRAPSPDALVARQAEAWNPILDWFSETYDAHFKTTSGIMPIEQDIRDVAKAASALTRETAMSLAPVHVMTTLTGSALLTIALRQKCLDADAAWTAAHVDEDWQIEQWGADADAEARRAKRRVEFDSAITFLRLLDSGS